MTPEPSTPAAPAERAILVWDAPVREYGSERVLDGTAVWDILAQFDPDTTVVVQEAAQLNPQFGAKGNYRNGDSHGRTATAVELWVRSSKGRHHLIDPAQWQRPILRQIRGAGLNTKGASIEFCRRMWPDAGIEKDGHADALCLAEWGRRMTLSGRASV